MIRAECKHRLLIQLALAAVIGLAAHSRASAAPLATVVAKVSATSVQVAEPFSLEWTVTAPVGAKVTFPSTGKQLGEFEVVDREDLFDIPDATADEARTWTRRLTLESIKTGEQSIPAVEFQVSTSGESKTIRANPITVQVVSVLEDRGDPTNFRDIESVVDVNVPSIRSKAWVWWTLSGAAGLALFAAFAMVVARRGQWVLPKEWALGELDKLENSVDGTTVQGDGLAMQLSRIVRDYLLLQFAIPESGHTTNELVQRLASNKLVDAECTDLLSSLFTIADKAKFAGLELSKVELKNAIRDARTVVQRIADRTAAGPHATDTKERC